MFQHIQTVELNLILDFLEDKKKAGFRIVSICPLYRQGFWNDTYIPKGYIVVVEKS